MNRSPAPRAPHRPRMRRAPAYLGSFLLFPLFAAFVSLPPAALAAKLHCREISFDGVAGAGSQDTVSFTIYGCDGNVVHESCPLKVKGSERWSDFLSRLVGSWGEPDFYTGVDQCPVPAEPLPKKACWNSLNGAGCNITTGEGCRSCRLKLKLKKKDTGQCSEPSSKEGDPCTSDEDCDTTPGSGDGACGVYKKRHVQICCYENLNCKKKLGKTDPGAAPITVQAEKNFSEVCPSDDDAGSCSQAVSDCAINLDPMGMVQFPGDQAKKCRATLASEVALLARTAIDAMVQCHLKNVLKGLPSDPSCNDPAAQPLVSLAEEGLRVKKIPKCAELGSPWRIGYRSCPAPCDSIAILTCTQGANIGAPCTTDRDCDSTPGGGDGQCGDWQQAGECLICQAEAAAAAAVTDKFGTPGALSPQAAKCQAAIGTALEDLVKTHLKETAACQKKRDAAKLPLPSTLTCADADPKGKRAKAEAAAAAAVAKACTDADIPQLDAICGGATTVAEVTACLIDNARSLNAAVAAASFPETAGGGPGTPSGGCPGTLELVWAAGGANACGIDAQCLPGRCVNGTCRTRTDIDVGWTGRGHDEDAPAGSALGLLLSCSAPQAPCGTCTIAGLDPSAGNCRCSNDPSVRCTQPLASDPACGGGACLCYVADPTPLLVPGTTPLCATHVLATTPAGTANVDSGEITLDASTTERIYAGVSTLHPCPTCEGDTIPRDGIADGVCSGGARDGLPCDAGATDYLYGTTSLDCPPDPAGNLSGTGLPLHLRLGTGSASLASRLTCGTVACPCGACSADPSLGCSNNADCAAAGAGQCLATGGAQYPAPQPNACANGVCTAQPDNEGICEGGPVDTFCDGVVRPNGRPVQPCATDFDCTLGGSCTIAVQRECFPDPIVSQGLPSPGYPVLSGASCLGATGDQTANGSLGLPGPVRVSLEAKARALCAADPSQTYTPFTGGCP